MKVKIGYIDDKTGQRVCVPVQVKKRDLADLFRVMKRCYGFVQSTHVNEMAAASAKISNN